MGQWLPGKHICVVGTARPEQRNPIYLTHELIVLILVVERETGVIVGCDINMVCSLTREFIKSVFEGKNLIRDIDGGDGSQISTNEAVGLSRKQEK